MTILARCRLAGREIDCRNCAAGSRAVLRRWVGAASTTSLDPLGPGEAELAAPPRECPRNPAVAAGKITSWPAGGRDDLLLDAADR
jgi:hypothetical protein